MIPGERQYHDGDRVRHARWGDGIVVTCKLTRSDEEITVAFKDPAIGRRRCSRASPTSTSSARLAAVTAVRPRSISTGSSASPTSSRWRAPRWIPAPSTTSPAARGTSCRSAEAEAAWRRRRLRPRVLVDVSRIDPSTTMAGEPDAAAGRDRADGGPRPRPSRRASWRRPARPRQPASRSRSRRCRARRSRTSPPPRPAGRAGSSSTPRPTRRGRGASSSERRPRATARSS